MENKNKEYFINKLEIIGYTLLILFFIISNYFLMKNINLLIDSDMSNELIYSQLLSEEKSFLSKNWYYSTELRVLNTQLIFAPLFLFTNNFYYVRVIGTIISEIILLLSFYYMCYKYKIKKIWLFLFFICGSCSLVYFDFFIKAPHYIPYLSTCFLSIGLLKAYIQSKTKNEKLIYICILVLLAILSSMNGARMVESLYAPLLLSICLLLFINIIKKEKFNKHLKELFFVILITFFASIIGYFICSKILANIYSFNISQFDLIINIPSIGRIKDVIYLIFTCFGYTNSMGLLYKIISFVFASATIVLTIFSSINVVIDKAFNAEDKLIVYLLFISCACTCMVLLFTNIAAVPRYLQLNTVLCYAIIALYYRNNNINIINFLVTIMAIFCIINNFLFTNYKVKDTSHNELFEMINIIKEERITEGIASFWSGAILNELTNNEIDAWHYQTFDYMDVNDILTLNSGKWLQRKEHFDRPPGGKIFFLIDKDSSFIEKEIIKPFLIYNGKYRQLYIFESYEQFVEAFIN